MNEMLQTAIGFYLLAVILSLGLAYIIAAITILVGWAYRYHIEINANFVWFDCWLGVYFDVDRQIIYIAPLPCCILSIEFIAQGINSI